MGAEGTGPSGDAEDTKVVGSAPALGSATDPRSGTTSGRRPRALGEGDTLGRYVVLEVAGRGGMGVVYRAYDPRLRREVAIKLLRLDPSGESLDTVAEGRLLREAQAMARLNHPNVLPIYDADRAADGLFIAMEYVEGRTLKAWLDEAPRSWRDVVTTLCAAGRGVAAAHASGIVHRDFKPSNVLVRADGRVLVMDFGLATVPEAVDIDLSELPMSSDTLSASGSDAIRTQAGFVLGTPAYMPPEQHVGAASHESGDQYAFCVTLWEALYGQRPFASKTYEGLVRAKHHTELPVDPPARGVPRPLHRAILRGLSVDPKARWTRLDTLLDTLEGLLQGQRRRRIAIAGAFAIAAWGTSLAVARGGSDEPDPCAPEPGRLAATYDDARAASIADAFARTEVPFAATTWERVAPRLDAYVDGLVTARVQACRDTHVRHSQSAELLDRRIACLDRREHALAALVGVFEDPNRELVERAVAASSGLPAIEPCADPGHLLAEIEPPADPEVTARVDALRRRLTEAAALHWAERYAELRERLDAIETEADATGYDPLRAEVTVERASLVNGEGDYDAAYEQLLAAYFLALQTGHDAVALRSAIDLVEIVGFRLVRTDEAKLWARHARGLLVRTRDDRRQRARLEDKESHLYQEAGEFEVAVAHAQAAIDGWTEVYGADDPRIASALHTMANAKARLRDADAAIELFSRAGEMVTRIEGPDHPSVAVGHNGIGNALAMKGDHQGALQHYQEAVRIWEAVLGPDHAKLGSVLYNMALALDHLGRYDEALAAHERSLAISRKVYGDVHPTIATSHQGIGLVYMSQGKWQQALDHFDETIEILEASVGPDHMRVGMALGNAGSVLEQLGREADAEAAWVRALPLLETAFSPEHPILVDMLVDLARVQAHRGDTTGARARLERAFAIQTKAAGPDDPSLARVQFLLAEALGPDRRTEARALAEKARATWATDPAANADRLARIDAWLRDH